MVSIKDSWEDFSSDDEVETLVEEEEEVLSKEVYDPCKEKREASEKEIRNLNSQMFNISEKLDFYKKVRRKLLQHKLSANNEPTMGHWLWYFLENYRIQFPEDEFIVKNGRSVFNNVGKNMLPKWYNNLKKKMTKWSNATDDKTFTVQHLNKIIPGNNGNDLHGKTLKQLITATGGTKEVVKKYILYKQDDIRKKVTKHEKILNKNLKEKQEKINNLKEQIEILKK
jgi:hypothetical protein